MECVEKMLQNDDGIRIDSCALTETSSLTDKVEATKVDTSNEDVWFDMRLTSHKGFGLFATQRIPRGTCIIIEPSLVTVPAFEPDIEHVWKEFKKLTPEQHDQVCDLFVPAINKPHYFGFFRQLLLRRQYTGVSLTAVVQDELKMQAIFSSNSLTLGSSDQLGKGLFLLTSRLQHSCMPNVQQAYNATLGMSTIHVTRDIKENEELTRSYIEHVYNNREQRAELLSRWNFDCDCAACQGPESNTHERRQLRIAEHMTGLAMYDTGVGSFGVSSPREAVAWAEEVVGLLKQQGVEDLELARAYRMCAKYCVDLGQLEKAMAYARKEFEVQRYCLGTETAHMEKDMKGAEFWIDHLEHVVEKDRVRIAMCQKRMKKEDKRADKKAAKKAAKHGHIDEKHGLDMMPWKPAPCHT